MKDVKYFLLASAFTVAFGFGASDLWAKDGVLNSTRAGETNYCHMHFPAIDERTLSWAEPVLKDASSGDIIHFYGPCDYDPHGKEAVKGQKLDEQRRSRRDNG